MSRPDCRLSAAFATTIDTPEHVAIAEDLGYRRAWLYDTPQQSPDVWMVLALAAARTTAIGLGPGVLVPSLRHPVVNAAAAAALDGLAPGRVAVGFGTGNTARRAMGQPKPLPWSYMSRYIETFRALLRGESAEWDGGAVRLLPQDEFESASPVDIPIYISALGPKGLQIAEQLGDGLFAVGTAPADADRFDDVACLVFGTVLDDGQSETGDAARKTGGPGAVQELHRAYERGDERALRALPGGAQWADAVSTTPQRERHFAVHTGHLLYLNQADAVAWNAGAHALLRSATLSGTAEEVRAKADTLAASGITEIVYQPAGDIRRELERFAAAIR